MNDRSCLNLHKFMEVQLEVIERHVDEHKWFQGIPDREAGVRDFIQKYAWLMREMYCLYACPERNKCKLFACPENHLG